MPNLLTTDYIRKIKRFYSWALNPSTPGLSIPGQSWGPTAHARIFLAGGRSRILMTLSTPVIFQCHAQFFYFVTRNAVSTSKHVLGVPRFNRITRNATDPARSFITSLSFRITSSSPHSHMHVLVEFIFTSV